MNVDDKSHAAELLWADLSENPALVASPAWHGDGFRNRLEQLQNGNASSQSWEVAISELMAELRVNQVLNCRPDSVLAFTCVH